MENAQLLTTASRKKWPVKIIQRTFVEQAERWHKDMIPVPKYLLWSTVLPPRQLSDCRVSLNLVLTTSLLRGIGKLRNQTTGVGAFTC